MKQLAISTVIFCLAVLFVLLVQVIPYFIIALATDKSIDYVHSTQFAIWWQPLGVTIIAIIGLVGLHRSKNWLRFFWAYAVLFSSGMLTFVLLFNPWNKIIPMIGADAERFNLAIRICLQVFGIGFAVCVNYCSLSFVLKSTEITLIDRIQLFFRLFFLPFCVIIIILLVLIPRTGTASYMQIKVYPIV